MLHRVFAVTTVLMSHRSAPSRATCPRTRSPPFRRRRRRTRPAWSFPRTTTRPSGGRKRKKPTSIYQSEEFQKKIALERERIQKEVFGREAYYKDSKKGSSTGGLGANERIYVFLSSSIPTETLRRYTSAAGALGDRNVRFVMRGFIGGAKYVKPTLRFVKDLLLEDPDCDPLKSTVPDLRHRGDHRSHALRALPHHPGPRLRLRDGERPKDPEKSEGLESNINIRAFHTVYGDVNFEYVLEAFEKETHSAGVSALLAGLRKGFYQH